MHSELPGSGDAWGPAALFFPGTPEWAAKLPEPSKGGPRIVSYMTLEVSSSKQLTKLRLVESGRPLVAIDRLVNLGFGQGFSSLSTTFVFLSVSFFFSTASSPPPTLQNTSVAIWCGWDRSCHHRAGQPADRKQRETEAKVPPLVWVGWVCCELTSQSSQSVTIRGQPALDVRFPVPLDRPKVWVRGRVEPENKPHSLFRHAHGPSGHSRSVL